MSENTFGRLLGQLVHSKRKILGLTQMQLAEDAYGTAGKTRRISELESGKVANPHPKTIDPIIVTLGITEEDLAQCTAKSNTKPNASLELAYSEARSLIDGLAEKFEYQNEDASLVDLEVFLTAKAEELVELKNKFQAIDGSEEEISDLRDDAFAALSAGDYEVVDELLKRAEYVQQENRTLTQIRKQANLRILRGDTHFLSGNLTECFKMYNGAAIYFEPFDLDEMAATFQNLAKVVYEAGRRSLEPTYWVAQKLLEEAISRYPSDGKPEVLGGMYFRLSLVLRNHVAHADKDEAEDLLDGAIAYARKSVLTLSDADDVFALASSQISLGNCLLDSARSKNDAAVSDQSVGVFEEARKAILENEELVELLGHACNGLGGALLQLDAATFTEANNGDCKKRAVAAFEEAVSASSRIFDPEIWGMAQINLGNLLAESARTQELGKGAASFLRIRALTNFFCSD